MSHVPHELAEEFPELIDRIHSLKLHNAHFLKLSNEYHDVNREIHRSETNVEPVSDAHMEDMRKRRMALKDEIFKMLRG